MTSHLPVIVPEFGTSVGSGPEGETAAVGANRVDPFDCILGDGQEPTSDTSWPFVNDADQSLLGEQDLAQDDLDSDVEQEPTPAYGGRIAAFLNGESIVDVVAAKFSPMELALLQEVQLESIELSSAEVQAESAESPCFTQEVGPQDCVPLAEMPIDRLALQKHVEAVESIALTLSGIAPPELLSELRRQYEDLTGAIDRFSIELKALMGQANHRLACRHKAASAHEVALQQVLIAGPHRVSRPLSGLPKWFNEAKGFGFVCPEPLDRDLFSHFSEIKQGMGFKSLKVLGGGAATPLSGGLWGTDIVPPMTRSLHVVAIEQGSSLQALLDRGLRPTEAELCEWMDAILRTLTILHGRSVVHGDIRPANVIVGHDHQLVLIDFGIANHSSTQQAMELGGDFESSVTSYTAPEQLVGGQIDRRTDIYACGVILYRLLTGREPFEESGSTSYEGVLNRPALLPSAIDAKWVHWDDIVLRTLSKSLDHRFASADDFAREVARVRRRTGADEKEPDRTLSASGLRPRLS